MTLRGEDGDRSLVFGWRDLRTSSQVIIGYESWMTAHLESLATRGLGDRPIGVEGVRAKTILECKGALLMSRGR